LQVSQQRRQIAGTLEYRPRRLPQVYAKLVSNDVRERCFTKTWRAEYQYMIHGLTTLTRSRNKNFHLRMHVCLPDVLAKG
jgi:hypothetical protein